MSEFPNFHSIPPEDVLWEEPGVVVLRGKLDYIILTVHFGEVVDVAAEVPGFDACPLPR